MQLWLNIYLIKVFPSDMIQPRTTRCRAIKNTVTSNDTPQCNAIQPLTTRCTRTSYDPMTQCRAANGTTLTMIQNSRLSSRPARQSVNVCSRAIIVVIGGS